MRQLHASKIADGITEIQFKDGVKDPYVKVTYYYPDNGIDGECAFKHSDRGHNDLHTERQRLAESITHLLGLTGNWNLMKVKFDWTDFEIKADLERSVEGYNKPIKCTTPAINDLVLDEVTPLFDEAAKYVTGEKRKQQEMFAETG